MPNTPAASAGGPGDGQPPEDPAAGRPPVRTPDPAPMPGATTRSSASRKRPKPGPRHVETPPKSSTPVDRKGQPIPDRRKRFLN